MDGTTRIQVSVSFLTINLFEIPLTFCVWWGIEGQESTSRFFLLGCWLSGVDINTQQSFEALSERAVAVVVDPIQSVKGKVVIGNI